MFTTRYLNLKYLLRSFIFIRLEHHSQSLVKNELCVLEQIQSNNKNKQKKHSYLNLVSFMCKFLNTETLRAIHHKQLSFPLNWSYPVVSVLSLVNPVNIPEEQKTWINLQKCEKRKSRDVNNRKCTWYFTFYAKNSLSHDL